MGLFARKQTIGSMQLNFVSKTQVVVNDQIPNATKDVPYPLWFAFLYAGKLLFNFPGSLGRSVVEKGIVELAYQVNTDDPFSYNETMLGVCCETEITIENTYHEGGKKYTGELCYKGDNLLVDTIFDWGEEDHYHRAAIDTVFETIRIRLGNKGGAIHCGVLGYFEMLDKYGCNKFERNIQFAVSAAMYTATLSGWLE
jgi:hypothetical protein